MKIIKYLKNRAFRVYFRIGAMAHVRHWRGHGVHSPFMYAIIRKVFMKNSINGADLGLYSELRSKHIRKKIAITLQNLYSHGKYNKYAVVDQYIRSENRSDIPTPWLCVILPKTSSKIVVKQLREAIANQGTIVVLSPNVNKAKRLFCKQIYTANDCVSVEKAHMTIYFFDHKLKKQHYRL